VIVYLFNIAKFKKISGQINHRQTRAKLFFKKFYFNNNNNNTTFKFQLKFLAQPSFSHRRTPGFRRTPFGDLECWHIETCPKRKVYEMKTSFNQNVSLSH
jgi:hypothetical protein